MKVHLARGRHAPELRKYFEPEKLDPFYSAEILDALHQGSWCSVLITSGRNALFHTFSKRRIGNSERFDIEPFLGYAGPVLNTDDPEFATDALAAYRQACIEEHIVAEFIRFNPLLQNQQPFAASELMEIQVAKDIVIVSCLESDLSQLAEFTESCARRVKKGKRECSYRKLTGDADLETFRALYRASLQRAGADAKWSLSDEFFSRLSASALCEIHGVFHECQLVSSCLVIHSGRSAYYLLVANRSPHVHGANEFLIFSIARDCSRQGIHHLILGGGNSASADDSLLRFKQKFSITRHPFFIGKMVHDKDGFDRLCAAPNAVANESPRGDFFLSYRATSIR